MLIIAILIAIFQLVAAKLAILDKSKPLITPV